MRRRRGAPRPTRIRAAALEALARPTETVADTLDRLALALVPACADGCEIVLTDSADEERRTVRQGAELETTVPGFAGLRRQALVGRSPVTWQTTREPTASCVVVCLNDDGSPIGTLACLTRAAPFDGADAAAFEDVGAAVAGVVGRALLRTRARVAARRSQRIASQLHQLLAASMIVAGLQREEDVLEAVARRARSVFDAEEVLVALESGPASPLRVAVRRDRSGSAREAATLATPPPAPGAGAPARTGEWLVAPLLARRGAARGSVSIRHRDGSAFSDDDLEVASLLAQLASSALDATELNRTIQQSEERLRVLVDTAPIGIVETDLTGVIRWWNRASAQIFSWGVDPDAPQVVGPSFPGALLDELQELWAGAVEGRELSAHDLPAVELGGRRRVLAASAALVPPTLGREGSLLTVVEDVTDHRQLMEELRHAQRMDVIGQLSSSVAHDFNNLLTLIAGYAELLMLETDGDGRTALLARDIQSTTTRASTLTGKLLTMGRTKLPEPVTFSPTRSVGELSEVLDRIIGDDIQLDLVLDPATRMIRADPDQFEQMIMNLATNARDAMGDGGSLRIAIGPIALERQPAAEAGLPTGEYVQVLVTDTGTGMDEEALRRCFEPLYTTKGPSKGTGLGLPAARRVVQESGGTIQVRSALGEGTTFEILFPVVDEEPTEEPPDVVAPRMAAGTTVLLAEDEDGIRELIGRILRHNGFVVHEAESAERAIEIAKGVPDRIELLVSDVVLGGMTGGDLAAILQEDDPELLVVLVSGNVDEAVLDQVRSGTGTFLPKPFKPSELMSVIDDLRARRAAAPG